MRLGPILAALLLLTSCATLSGLGQNVARYKVVKIEGSFAQGGFTATGSHLGNGVILTNQHVCFAFEDPSFIEMHVRDMDGHTYAVTAFVATPDPVTDLCLLKTNARDLPREVLAGDEAVQDTMGHIIGYPLGKFAEDLGYIREEGDFLILDPAGIKSEHLVRIEVITAPGNSGSPILNEQGRLVGVLNAGSSFETLFVPLQKVKEFLKYAIPVIEHGGQSTRK